MLSLIYVSVATCPLTQGELKRLADGAAHFNESLNVTGLLAYNTQSFMQLLEGDGADVLHVMSRIEKDSRHHNITFIRQDVRDDRECPGWSMRSLLTPMTGLGSANVFTGSLPRTMELDTQILFTSFASTLTAAQAAQHAQRSRALRDGANAQND